MNFYSKIVLIKNGVISAVADRKFRWMLGMEIKQAKRKFYKK